LSWACPCAACRYIRRTDIKDKPHEKATGTCRQARLQLVAPNGCERRLLDVGAEIERLLAFDRRPTGFD
jgi:hypothetical protein